MKVQNQFDSQFVFLSESAKREQIEILFRENRKRLLAAAKAVTKNSFDAEDAVQNVFLKLLERDGVPVSYCRNPKTYLWQATHREAPHIVRNQKTRKLSDDPIEATEIAAPEEEPVADPSRVERLRRAMSSRKTSALRSGRAPAGFSNFPWFQISKERRKSTYECEESKSDPCGGGFQLADRRKPVGSGQHGAERDDR